MRNLLTVDSDAASMKMTHRYCSKWSEYPSASLFDAKRRSLV